jgi:signal recognition particle subunit SRP54
MASALTDKLSQLVKQISGQARITESNVSDMLREVRMALLEADVALPVVRDFIARVKEKSLGQEVLGSLKPGQALVAIVNRELAATMGDGVADINLAAQPPAVILMAGLQGAGKTTTTAKLAKHLIEKRKKKVLTVSGDVYRPAAIEQLKTVTAQSGAEWFPSSPDQKPLDIARAAIDYARKHFFDVLLVDTAGRLAIDEALMAEIRELACGAEPCRNFVCGRCHARSRRRQYRQGLQRCLAAHGHCADQNGWRFARWCGAVSAPNYGCAHQVCRYQRKN